MSLIDLIRYICLNSPNPDELSLSRLNKIIYLIDWKSAVEYQQQITSIEWYTNDFGPYIQNLEDILKNDSRFELDNVLDLYGKKKNIISLLNDKNFLEPNKNEKLISDFVLQKVEKFYWNEFLNLVYSTYPIISQEKNSKLELVKLAKVYNLLKKKDI